MKHEEILMLRARALARVPEAVETTTGARALVAAIGPAKYGFPIEHVIRVRAVGRCTPVPNAPRGVVGIAQLEGKIMAVFGGRSWRGLPEEPRTDIPVLLLGSHESPLALLVDSVVATIGIPDDVPDLRGPGEPWLRAIVDGVLLVDVPRLIEQVSDHRPPAGRGSR